MRYAREPLFYVCVLIVWPYQYAIVVPLQLAWTLIFGTSGPPWDWDDDEGRMPDLRPWFIDRLRARSPREHVEVDDRTSV